MKAKRPHKQQKAYCPYCRLSTYPAQIEVVVSLLYATGTACILKQKVREEFFLPNLFNYLILTRLLLRRLRRRFLIIR